MLSQNGLFGFRHQLQRLSSVSYHGIESWVRIPMMSHNSDLHIHCKLSRDGTVSVNLRCRGYRLRDGLPLDGDFRDLRATIDLSKADFAGKDFAEHFRHHSNNFGGKSKQFSPCANFSYQLY